MKDIEPMFDNVKYDNDLVVSGLGFVKISSKGRINVYVNKEVEIFFRKSLI